MLSRVIIENFALIDTLDVEFDRSLNIITGETGAGKSIILGAMGLIMGTKADITMLKDSTKNCIVEMHFAISESVMADVFSRLELDFSPKTIIRRVINPEGKSRAYVNDLPVTLATLKDLTSLLIDIHSQHQTLLLGENKFQTDLVDNIAAHHSLLSDYQKHYTKITQLKSELTKLQSLADSSSKDFDYITFQRDELLTANLADGGQQELETLILQLSHADEICQTLFTGATLLNGDEGGMLSQLKNIENSLHKISKIYSNAQPLYERIESAIVELKDIANEMDTQTSKMQTDPQKLLEYQEKLDLIYRLEQKHKVNSIEELLELLTSYNDTLNKIESYEETINSLRQSIDDEYVIANDLAKKITENRVASSPIIKKSVETGLSSLGIPNAKFEIEIAPKQSLEIDGADNIKFIFSANKNTPLQAIEKIASGGEMSRLMLTLKGLVAQHKSMPTIIFDEIDTGISGEIAHKMGEILEQMSENMQIINITHLPQIAARGDNHYFVYKSEGIDNTTTQIRKLTDVERINEIAKMLSGSGITDAAINQAKILLKN